MLVVPGSESVKRHGRSRRASTACFVDAGAEWRLPGCSMCIAMNGDFVGPGQLAVSTSNRNFEGRQGKGARTILASPATAAASAVAGHAHRPARIHDGRRSMREKLDANHLATRWCWRRRTSTPIRSFPARFLTTTTREGLGAAAFYDWRYNDERLAQIQTQRSKYDRSQWSTASSLPATTSPAAHHASMRHGRSTDYGFQSRHLHQHRRHLHLERV